MKYIALKRFGGGSRLRSIYGTGVGRLVQLGTIMEEKDFNNESHRKDLLGKDLIAEFDEKRTYQTQADRDRRAKAQRRNQAAPAPEAKAKAKA